MRPLFLRTAVSISALLSGTAAMADITAQDVWDNWKSNMVVWGDEVVTFGSETLDGDTLIVTDLALSAEDEDVRFSTMFGAITFTENGDGTVSVTMQDSYTATIGDLEGEEGAILEVSQPGLTIFVSGDPGAMNYDISADRYAVTLTETFGDNAPSQLEAFIRMSAVSGSYQTDLSSGTNTTFGFATGSIDMFVDMQHPTEGRFLWSGKMEDVTTSGEWDLPEGADLDIPETFQDDFTLKGETNAASTAFLLDFDLEGNAANGSIQAGAFKLGGDINDKDFSYVMSLSEAAISAQSPDLPLPVSGSLGLFEFILGTPIVPSEQAEPFTFKFSLVDLATTDEIWSLGDPSGVLPRDPITFEIDLTGMAQMLGSVFDDEAVEFQGDPALDINGVPGVFESVSINTVKLAGIGTEITADGAFTFDNDDLDTFDGFPRPEGELNMGITGANALIDTLIDMGLLPAEQATMGRMMMGMFTQPAGDDALTSKIEINAEGHVLANGQRIQ